MVKKVTAAEALARTQANRKAAGMSLLPEKKTTVKPIPTYTGGIDPKTGGTLPTDEWSKGFNTPPPEETTQTQENLAQPDDSTNLEDFVQTVTDEQRVENDFQNKKTKSAQDYAAGIIKTDPYANYKTLDDWRTAQSQQQQDLINQQQGNVNAVNAIENADFQANTAKSQSAIAGVYASMAQGREGVMGSSQPLVAGGFKTRTEAIISQNQARLNLAQSQRQQAIEGMKRAAEEGDAQAEASYKAQLDQAQQDILAEETQAAKLAESAASTAASLANVQKTKVDTITNQFTAMGESAANLDTPTLISMADEAGLTFGQVSAMQQTAVLTAQLGKAKTQGEVDQINANIAKLQKELPAAGMTADQQNFEYYKNLSPAQQAEYDHLKSIGSFQLGTDQYGNPIVFNKDTGLVKNFNAAGNGTFEGSNGDIADALAIADGTKVGQCGAFVNDYTGLSMGDTFQSKMAQTDPALKGAVPQMGDVFVMPYTNKKGEEIGHAGIVVNVSADGNTVTVKDSNWKLDEKVLTHNISANSITGLARPAAQTQSESALMKVPKDLRTMVKSKASEFDSETQVKNFQVVQEGVNFVNSIPSDTTNPADDIGFIYAFAKIMDPNSVVREGEYATVQKYAQSWADSFGFKASRVFSNTKFLSTEAIENMKATLQSRYNASEQTYDQTRNQYVQTLNNMAGVDIGNELLQDYKIQEQETQEPEEPLIPGYDTDGYKIP